MLNNEEQEKAVLKIRNDYKAKFAALRIQEDEEELEQYGVHLKQRSRAT
jgi:hypothetical protein